MIATLEDTLVRGYTRLAAKSPRRRIDVERVLDAHVSGRTDLSRQLWSVLALTLWHERHVEGITRDVSLEQAVTR